MAFITLIPSTRVKFSLSRTIDRNNDVIYVASAKEKFEIKTDSICPNEGLYSRKLYFFLKRTLDELDKNCSRRFVEFTMRITTRLPRPNQVVQFWRCSAYAPIKFSVIKKLYEFVDEPEKTVLRENSSIFLLDEAANLANIVALSPESEMPVEVDSMRSTMDDIPWTNNMSTCLSKKHYMKYDVDHQIYGDLEVILCLKKDGLQTLERLLDHGRYPNPFNPLVPNYCRVLLQEKLHTDLSIVTDTGATVLAHKGILAACSPALAETFNVPKWSGRGAPSDQLVLPVTRLQVEGVSEATVHAFLDYLYCSDMEKPIKSVKIAAELLVLSNRYLVRSLEEKLLEVLMLQPVSSFDDIEMLLHLFLFLNYTGICTDLEVVLGYILEMKSEEIQNSESYEQLCRENPEAGKLVKEKSGF